MFASRQEAGRLLGERLRELSLVRPVVLGITRGGVVVAAEVARKLSAPLYPLVIKKIGHPYNSEFALGAMGPGGDVVISDQSLVISEGVRDQIKDKRNEMKERIKEYGVEDLEKKIKGKTMIIVDDGIATGWTVRAAVAYAKSKIKNQKSKIIVAVPVADREIIRQLQKIVTVSEIIVLEEVDGLGAVGNYYEEFSQVSDDEVKSYVREAASGAGSRG